MPKYVNCRIQQSGRSYYGNSHQRVFEIHPRRDKENQVSRQRFRKPAGTDEPTAGRIDCQPGNGAYDERVPGVTLEGDINNHHQGKINVRERKPDFSQRQLHYQGKCENGRDF